jgi:hypothetical protein
MFLEHPRDVFLRDVWIKPLQGDDLEGRSALMGANHILFGSDYPHPEGMADALNWLKQVADLHSARDVAQLLDENLSTASWADSGPEER